MSFAITLTVIIVLILILVFTMLGMSIRVVKQYEQGVLFRLGRVIGVRMPGLRFIIPVVRHDH